MTKAHIYFMLCVDYKVCLIPHYRGLDFTLEFLLRLVSDLESENLEDNTRDHMQDSYKSALAQHHNFVIKKTVQVRWGI